MVQKTIDRIVKRFKLWRTMMRNNVEKYEVSTKSIDAIMRNRAGDYWERLDDFYTTCDEETMKLVASIMPIKWQKYRIDTHDCDDFASEFKVLCRKLFPTLAIGKCRVELKNGTKHALNWCIYKSKKGNNVFSYIEPQTGELIFPDYVCTYYMEM